MTIRNLLQDFLVVGLITAMIWLYAEGQDIQDYPSDGPRELLLNLRLPLNSGLVIEAERLSPRVQFTVAASRAADLKNKLDRQGGIIIPLGNDGQLLTIGDHTLNLKDELERNLKVGVRTVEPSTVSYRIDKLVPYTIPLTFKIPEDLKLKNQAQMEPTVARIILPKKLLEQWLTRLETEALRVEPNINLRELPAEVTHKITARISLPPMLASNPNVKLLDTEAVIQLSLTENVRQKTLATVPVWPWSPQTVFNDYTVRIHPADQLQQNVQVKGSVEQIAKIEENPAMVIAKLRLDNEFVRIDLGKERSAPITFDLPPGVTVIGGDRSVRFTITRRPDAGI